MVQTIVAEPLAIMPSRERWADIVDSDTDDEIDKGKDTMGKNAHKGKDNKGKDTKGKDSKGKGAEGYPVIGAQLADMNSTSEHLGFDHFHRIGKDGLPYVVKKVKRSSRPVSSTMQTKISSGAVPTTMQTMQTMLCGLCRGTPGAFGHSSGARAHFSYHLFCNT
jgi:hypothetical protein